MRKLWSRSGWFNGKDDGEPAILTTDATDEAEVRIEIESDADWTGDDPKPVACIYLNPVDALQHAEQVRQAAIDALPESVFEKHA